MCYYCCVQQKLNKIILDQGSLGMFRMSEGTKVVRTYRWPKAFSSRSERAARRAEKMRARSARFFSYLKLGRSVCLFVQQKMNKIILDQGSLRMSRMSEGIKGDRG